MPHAVLHPAPPVTASINPIERQVLETIASRGPTHAARLPTRWPLIRMHLPLVIDRLAAAGLVHDPSSPDNGGALRLTERGRAVLSGVTYPGDRP